DRRLRCLSRSDSVDGRLGSLRARGCLGQIAARNIGFSEIDRSAMCRFQLLSCAHRCDSAIATFLDELTSLLANEHGLSEGPWCHFITRPSGGTVLRGPRTPCIEYRAGRACHGSYWKAIISVRLSVGAFGFKGSLVRLPLP